MQTETEIPPKQFKTPDTMLIMFVIGVLAWLATALVPAGRFLDVENGISLDKFETVGRQPMPFFASGGEPGFLNLFFDGLVSGGPYSAAVGLMAFLLIIGGVFGIIMRTGTMEAGLGALIKDRDGEADWLPPLLFVLFALGGATFGMSEESIVFTIMLLPAFLRLGYDSLTVIAVCFVGTQVGFGTSWMNPFSVVVAQGIADVEVLSGLYFRLTMWVAFTAIGAAWVYRYARSVRLGKTVSRSAASDAVLREAMPKAEASERFGIGHALILLTFVLGIIWVVWGVSQKGYYFPELGAQFLTMGLVSALIARVFGLGGMDFNAAAEAFQEGAMQLVPAVLIIGFAKGIIILLGGDDAATASVLNTILAGIASFTSQVPEQLVGVAMFASQSVINLAVASGSSQAALTMPIMAPLADLSGLSRQSAVLAFQLGDGFTNVITPASPVLIGCLAAAKLSWATWAAFIWRFLAAMLGLSVVVMVIAVAIGFS
ncbi:MAG: putative basic amino acid antiporter YfcC [Pseudomonadota bacterium]